MEIFIVTQNSDTIEGKGTQVPIGYYSDLKSAVQKALGKGVMGAGDGDVYSVVLDSDSVDKKKVYGYRKSLSGKWGYGYVDNRDEKELLADPDFQTYLKLKKRFEENA